VPITNSTVATGGVQAFSTVDQEAKLSLKITPQINKVTRFVKLKINQKIDDFKQGAEQVAGKGLPKATRAAITEVMVRDRDTIAMGGLLREVERVENAKVPILGDIPVLGWLFKSQTKSTTKVNLLFFITPKILAPYAKTASLNTKEVLKRREKGMKEMFEDDEIDPNAKVSKDLTSKLDRQTEGPLYDMADADHYKNLNNEEVGPDENAIDEEMDVPDYQEIRKSVE
jgi:general secretion pathway protein D